MKRSAVTLAILTSATLLGVFSAYADGVIEYYWQHNDLPLPLAASILLIAIIGNAAGAWALGAAFAGYFAARAFRLPWAVVLYAGMFLVGAITAYYLAIDFGNLRPGAVLIPAIMKWYLMAVPVAIVSGLAGYGLARGKNTVATVLSALVILGYVGLDCFIFIRAQGGMVGAPLIVAMTLYGGIVLGAAGWCWRVAHVNSVNR